MEATTNPRKHNNNSVLFSVSVIEFLSQCFNSLDRYIIVKKILNLFK